MAQKKVKTFRISPHIATLLRKAADASGESEAEIIERCIVSQANRIASDAEFRNAILADARMLDMVAKRLADGAGE
jgi:uncharacterized protein (DUF1778 family)